MKIFDSVTFLAAADYFRPNHANNVNSSIHFSGTTVFKEMANVAALCLNHY